jgi:hypothetical protein
MKDTEQVLRFTAEMAQIDLDAVDLKKYSSADEYITYRNSIQQKADDANQALNEHLESKKGS